MTSNDNDRLRQWFEVWDSVTKNMLSDFPTAEEAWAFVAEVGDPDLIVLRNGPDKTERVSRDAT